MPCYHTQQLSLFSSCVELLYTESNLVIFFFFAELQAVSKVHLISQCFLVLLVVNVESRLAIPEIFVLSAGGFAGAL